MAQAKRDLKAARDSLADENYEWVCFQSQQSAEKALKALLRFHNQEAKGHTIIQLLAAASQFEATPVGMQARARELDRHYIQPRYPNGFAAGYPGEFYDAQTAAAAVEHVDAILQFVETHVRDEPSA